jgi:hypothetical protein
MIRHDCMAYPDGIDVCGRPPMAMGTWACFLVSAKRPDDFIDLAEWDAFARVKSGRL